MTHRLELKDVSKSFGEVQSLRNVDMHVDQNEIVGLLGDNGAGKSTLIKIITGYHQPTSGEIYFNGQRVEHLTVPKARKLGVETVYQERALADQQTLWRNIFMGRELSNALGFMDVKRMQEETSRLMLQSMGFTSGAVTPDSQIKNFSGGEMKSRGSLLSAPCIFRPISLFWTNRRWGYRFRKPANLLNLSRASNGQGNQPFLLITMSSTCTP